MSKIAYVAVIGKYLYVKFQSNVWKCYAKSEEIRIEREISAEIAKERDTIEYLQDDIVRYQMFIGIETDKAYIREYKRQIKLAKDRIAQCKRRIKGYEWVLSM